MSDPSAAMARTMASSMSVKPRCDLLLAMLNCLCDSSGISVAYRGNPNLALQTKTCPRISRRFFPPAQRPSDEFDFALEVALAEVFGLVSLFSGGNL
jgi:hypothetical protein